MRHLLIALTLLVMSITPTIAQTDEAESWEIIERCVGEPTEPPDDWSFEGVIFLESDIGIHGMNSQIDTPYVIAFESSLQSFARNGSLSPNGSWFAVPYGTTFTDWVLFNGTWSVNIQHIFVYSTDGRRQQYSVDTDIVYNGASASSSVYPPQWISNNEFVYERYPDRVKIAVNPFTGEEHEYEGDYQPQHLVYETQLSYTREQIDEVRNILGTYPYELKFSTDELLFGVLLNNVLHIGDKQDQIIFHTCLHVDKIAWSPNGELAVSDGERISIINFENNTHYIVAYHEGSVFDWRVPPEED